MYCTWMIACEHGHCQRHQDDICDILTSYVVAYMALAMLWILWPLDASCDFELLDLAPCDLRLLDAVELFQ